MSNSADLSQHLHVHDDNMAPPTAAHQHSQSALFDSLFDGIPIGVLLVDHHKNFSVRANRAADSLLGHRRDVRFLTDYVFQKNDGSAYPSDRLPIQRAIDSGARANLNDDLFVCRADASRIQVDMWAAPISWPGSDRLDAVICVIQDITERKRMEAASHEQQVRELRTREELYQDEKMRSIARLAGGLAHDYNNMLVAVLGNASILQSEISPDHPWHDLVTSILRSAERAAKITRQLLAYSRSGPFAPKPVRLRTVLADSLALCRSAVHKSVRIDFEARTEDDTAEVDASQMQQILLNLVMNSAEAMPDGGQINIIMTDCLGPCDSALAGTPTLCVHVIDNGSGIPVEHQNKIFEPFFTTKEFGRGLGLASVHGMLENHGATIDLVSTPQGGAEFLIYFPKTKPPVARTITH